jgi:hypothetical protein
MRAEQKAAFLAALRLFVSGLNDQHFDPRLRVKRIQGHAGVWEMSWAADGRATFLYGEQMIAGEAHVICGGSVPAACSGHREPRRGAARHLRSRETTRRREAASDTVWLADELRRCRAVRLRRELRIGSVDAR